MFSRRRINTRAITRQSTVITAALTLIAAPLAILGGNTAVNLIQDNGTGPIDAFVQEVSLAESASVLVDDAAIATQSLVDEAHPNRGVVKEITSETEFSQFALTWTGSADIASFVRAERPDGTWSEWYAAEPEYPADGRGNGLNGTELIYVEPTKKVQVSTHGLNIFGPDSGVNVEDIRGAEDLNVEQLDVENFDVEKLAPTTDAPAGESAPAEAEDTQAEPNTSTEQESAPADKADKADKAQAPDKWTDIIPVAEELPLSQVEAVLIDGNAAASAIDPIADAEDVTGMPKVITRAGWGANEANRCQSPYYDDELVAATVHHTAGSNNYTEAQAASLVRGIYQYHAQSLGWCDIGYNALVDKYGNIYEGRYGGLNKNVQGAHAGGFNQGTFGISMMGDYSTVQPSQATINAVGNMIGWRLHLAGVTPKGQNRQVSGGTHYSKYGYGQTVTLPNIFAHRDVGNTTCPGDAGYAQMDRIRDIASAKYTSLANGTVKNETPGGITDLLVKPGTGNQGTTEQTSNTGSANSTTASSTSTSATSSATSSATASSSATSSATKTNSATSSATATSAEPTAEVTSSSSATKTNSATSATSATSTPATGQPTSAPATAEPTAEPTSEPTTGLPSIPATGTPGSGSSESGTGTDTETDPQADAQAEQSKADALAAISGARSMLASALGLLGAPGLAATADAILESVGRSIENGPSIDDLPVLIDKILTINEENDLAAEWRDVNERFGAVLGSALSGIQYGSTVSNTSGIADPLQYVKFENGVITSSKTTGTHALWGEIAEAWANQGFEVGQLGAPTSTQTVDGNVERAQFQNGTLTFDRTTGEVSTQLD